jgi:hypothetical protein
MGARPSGYKKSGGFLNGVDGTITAYRFTDDQPSKDGPVAFKAGKVKGTDGKLKERFHTLYMELSARADGAKEDVTTHLFGGGYDDFTVSEDGLTLTAIEDGAPVTLGGNTDVARFVTSLVEAGFPETNFDEDETQINFEPMVGARVRFVQRRDEEATKKFGKRVDKRTGKSYDRQYLVVDQVYDLAQAETKTNGAAKTIKKAAAAPAKAVTPAKGTKPAKAAAEDVSELATQTLLDILGENDNSIQKIKLSTRILQRLMKHPQRDDVRKWLFNDENLAGIEGVSYDQAEGTISVE